MGVGSKDLTSRYNNGFKFLLILCMRVCARCVCVRAGISECVRAFQEERNSQGRDSSHNIRIEIPTALKSFVLSGARGGQLLEGSGLNTGYNTQKHV